MATNATATQRGMGGAGGRAPARLERLRTERERMCGDKVRHPTREAARSQLLKLGQHGTGVYLCKYCGHFHIGHVPRRELERVLAGRAPGVRIWGRKATGRPGDSQDHP